MPSCYKQEEGQRLAAACTQETLKSPRQRCAEFPAQGRQPWNISRICVKTSFGKKEYKYQMEASRKGVTPALSLKGRQERIWQPEPREPHGIPNTARPCPETELFRDLQSALGVPLHDGSCHQTFALQAVRQFGCVGHDASRNTGILFFPALN